MGVIFVIYFYLLVGFIYALYFVNHKIKKIDTAAIQPTFLFKLLILGGCILLWPILINKKKHTTYMIRPLRKKHLIYWICIAVILLIAVVAAYVGSIVISKY